MMDKAGCATERTLGLSWSGGKEGAGIEGVDIGAGDTFNVGIDIGAGDTFNVGIDIGAGGTFEVGVDMGADGAFAVARGNSIGGLVETGLTTG